MIATLAISGYRSLRELVLPLERLTAVTGANGSGKSSLYRALRLLSDAAQNQVVASLAREGGLPSTLWAGPEEIARSMRLGEQRYRRADALVDRRNGVVSLAGDKDDESIYLTKNLSAFDSMVKRSGVKRSGGKTARR